MSARLSGPTALRPAARALAARLDGTLDRAAVDLVAHAVDWTRPEATHDDLRGVAARTGPYVTTAVDGLAAGLLPRLARLYGTTVRTALRALAETDAVGAAVAVGLVARAGAAENWTPPWRAALADLREHPDRRVRGDARDVVIDPE